jgi:hypothetical protein
MQGRGTLRGSPGASLTAVQFEQAERPGAIMMVFRALALQEQLEARRIQSGEIVCVANHDVETKSCLPFLIGKVCQTPFLQVVLGRFGVLAGGLIVRACHPPRVAVLGVHCLAGSNSSISVISRVMGQGI